MRVTSRAVRGSTAIPAALRCHFRISHFESFERIELRWARGSGERITAGNYALILPKLLLVPKHLISLVQTRVYANSWSSATVNALFLRCERCARRS